MSGFLAGEANGMCREMQSSDKNEGRAQALADHYRNQARARAVPYGELIQCTGRIVPADGIFNVAPGKVFRRLPEPPRLRCAYCGCHGTGAQCDGCGARP